MCRVPLKFASRKMEGNFRMNYLQIFVCELFVSMLNKILCSQKLVLKFCLFSRQLMRRRRLLPKVCPPCFSQPYLTGWLVSKYYRSNRPNTVWKGAVKWNSKQKRMSNYHCFDILTFVASIHISSEKDNTKRHTVKFQNS